MPATIRSTSNFIASGSVTTGTVPLPAGWQPGDIFYIVAVLAAATGTITAPGGYTTEVASFHSAASTSASMALFSKKLASGDTAPAVTCTSGRLCCIGVAVQGADQVTWTDVAAASDTNSGVTFPSVRAPSITPVTPGCLLITFHGEYNSSASTGGTFTPDASETEADDQTTTVAAVSDVAVEVAWAQLADTSATGTKTATNSTSGTTTGPMGIAVAVRAAVLAGGGYAQPGQAWLRRFHHRQFPPPAGPVAAQVMGPAGIIVFAAPLVRPGPHRARLGAAGALAAGILAAGIGPPPVPAPHLPPVISHPAPHRAQWRSGHGSPPGALPQPFKPATVYRRVPHGAGAWRAGQGTSPGVTPQKRYPVTIFARPAHRALWRGTRGTPPAALPQPFRPAPIGHPAPHRAQWRGIAGTAAGAVLGTGLPQPFRPVTVYARAAHRALWRAITGPPPVAAQNLGAAPPFKPPTVYRRALHGALWRAIRGAVPAAARQPRTPATVFARAVHRVLWRAAAGSPAPPPPTLQNAASALLVTDPDTSAATVTEPRATAAGARSPHTGGIYTGAYQGTYAPDPAPPGPRATGTPVTGTVTEQGATRPGVSDG